MATTRRKSLKSKAKEKKTEWTIPLGKKNKEKIKAINESIRDADMRRRTIMQSIVDQQDDIPEIGSVDVRLSKIGDTIIVKLTDEEPVKTEEEKETEDSKIKQLTP